MRIAARSRLAVAATLAVSAALAACGGGSSDSVSSGPKPLDTTYEHRGDPPRRPRAPRPRPRRIRGPPRSSCPGDPEKAIRVAIEAVLAPAPAGRRQRSDGLRVLRHRSLPQEHLRQPPGLHPGAGPRQRGRRGQGLGRGDRRRSRLRPGDPPRRPIERRDDRGQAGARGVGLEGRLASLQRPGRPLRRCPAAVQATTWTSTVRSRGRSSKSTRTSCCQVPSARRPPLTGTTSEGPITEARWWAWELVSWLSRLCS